MRRSSRPTARTLLFGAAVLALGLSGCSLLGKAEKALESAAETVEGAVEGEPGGAGGGDAAGEGAEGGGSAPADAGAQSAGSGGAAGSTKGTAGGTSVDDGSGGGELGTGGSVAGGADPSSPAARLLELLGKDAEAKSKENWLQRWLEDVGEWIPLPVSILGFLGVLLVLAKVRSLFMRVESVGSAVEAIRSEMSIPPSS